MALKDIAEFRSTTFTPFLPDDCQVNPGVYGAELAYWISKQLAERGVITSYPMSEDWGWYVEFVTDHDAEFALHCYNVDGAGDHWLVSLRRFPRKLFGRDKPPYEKAARLIDALRQILADEPTINGVKWLYSDSAG